MHTPQTQVSYPGVASALIENARVQMVDVRPCDGYILGNSLTSATRIRFPVHTGRNLSVIK